MWAKRGKIEVFWAQVISRGWAKLVLLAEILDRNSKLVDRSPALSKSLQLFEAK
jgi:hypothetical protein